MHERRSHPPALLAVSVLCLTLPAARSTRAGSEPAAPVPPSISVSPSLVPVTPDCAFVNASACPQPDTVTLVVTYTLGSTRMETGGGIAVSLGEVLGGRYRRRPRMRWEDLQIFEPTQTEFVSASTSREDVPITVGLASTWDGGREILVLAQGPLLPDDRITVTLGDRSFGGGGMRVPGLPFQTRVIVRERLEGPGAGFDYLDTKYGLSFPIVETHGAVADHYLVTLPSEAVAGVPVTAVIRAVAGAEGIESNAVPVRDHAGPVDLTPTDPLAELPPQPGFSLDDRGVLRVPVVFRTPGLQTLTASGPQGSAAVAPAGSSNPVLVLPSAPRWRTLWGQLHVHTGLSRDGSGEAEDAFLSARDEAGFDFLAVSDHCDTVGYDFGETARIADRLDDPGRFAALPAYEWTNALEGHRHLVYPTGADATAGCEDLVGGTTGLFQAPTLAEVDAAAAERGAVTIVHHPLWVGPLANPVTAFTFGDPLSPPPTQKLLEIFSSHGRSEEYDNTPYLMHGSSDAQQSPSRAASFQDALRLGFRFGLVSGSDNHMAQSGAVIGFNFGSDNVRYSRQGLTAVLAESATRAALFKAFRQRRTYGTTGARIRLRVTGNGRPMGSEIVGARSVEMRIQVVGTAPLTEIVMVRNGVELAPAWQAPAGATRACLTFRDRPEPRARLTSYYVRVHQADDHLAWSSPVFYQAPAWRASRSSRASGPLAGFEASTCDATEIQE